ncbi:alpha-galactosidase [Pedobacter sp. MC2016-14]|uniref:alpha-galactosidase n=1 Tax=Pedobacter sp. MC2016-14 TaxID=2897327 RepID=UPI001E4CCF54|nr:alpha-galactosidase [Pedobacter sp. MC2016-14]MCD0487239.1 alpha-galactosidase [Pedobacter sp. MC2016-14]
MKLKVSILLFTFLAFLKPVSAIVLPYGKVGKIIYDLKSGTYDVFDGQVQVLRGGFSSARNYEKLLISKEYGQASYAKESIKDAFGPGTKHIVVLKHAGWPDMKQVFYTYPGRSYFLCEVAIQGGNLQSNQLIPLQGNILSMGNPGLLTSLFVPFDNDAFIRYDTKILNPGAENISSEVGALYNNTSRKGIVTGSVTHEVWKTGVRTWRDDNDVLSMGVTTGYTARDLTRDQLPHGAISGRSILSARVFFGAFTDWRRGMEDYAKANRLAEPPIVFKWDKPTPVGWNSWGVIQDKISYDKATKVVDFFADDLKGFRNGGTAYVDLDSYWDMMLNGGLEGDYSKLKAFADYTKKRGLKPGVYWAPFTDWGFNSGGNRRAEGGQYNFAELWTKVGHGYHDFDGARALDPTHPGTQQRIKLVIGKLKECGFEMIKIDFLGHAAAESDHFYDPAVKTGMQAYKVGMEYLIKQLDSKMLVYAAISPSMASGRYIHARRIACDAFKSINDTEYTLNSLTNGWWQTWLYDYLDADHVVFNDASAGENVARMLSAFVTGSVLLGDDFSTAGPWTEGVKRLVQNPALLELIKDGKSFIPVEGNKGQQASELFIKSVKNVHYLAIFNYSKAPKSFPLSLKKLGLSTKVNWSAVDLISKKSALFSEQTTIEVPAGNARIFKLTLPPAISDQF